MPDDSYFARFRDAALSGLRTAADAASGLGYLLNPTDLERIGDAEQGSWMPSTPLVSATSAERAPARTPGAPTLAERAAYDYNRKRPTPSIYEELTGSAKPAWTKSIDALVSLADPLGGGPAKAAALPGITRKAAGFSLQGELDDILRGGGQSLDDIADVAPAGRISNNASGESAASLEELGRRAWAKQTGRKAVVMDRAGRTRDLLATPGDQLPNPGERHGWLMPDGRFEEVARGR
jgi:hypothetical protein